MEENEEKKGAKEVVGAVAETNERATNIQTSARADIDVEGKDPVVIGEEDSLGIDSNNQPVVAGQEDKDVER